MGDERKGTVIPLPPSPSRLAEAGNLEKPQNFVPSVSVHAGGGWGAGPARKLVPTGIVGERGASYTVFESNWKCEECHTENAATRARCQRCRARKPARAAESREEKVSPSGDEDEEAAEESVPQTTEWREVFDPNTKVLYYANSSTGATQWERPASMGPTPHSSGWFGRGAAGSTAAAGYERNNEAYLKRPARKQVEYVAAKKTVLEGAYEYNIWYGKHVGGEAWGKTSESREPAETRCVLATDAGRTKADGATKSYGTANFCLFFARGCCGVGRECRYFHRIPVKKDVERFAKDETHDVFGRERHRDFRDDMTGVGSMTKPCRTLYVGGLLKSEYASPAALEDCLWRHFGEWGEVENVNLVSRLSICFIRYRFRSAAEFAKEAMANNHLDFNENLNVRWAHEDPNPVALDAAARADADALVEMLQAQGVAVTADDAALGFDTPAHYSAKRPRLGLNSDYPDTDAQYDASTLAVAAASTEPDPDRNWQPVTDAAGTTSYWWNTVTNQTSTHAPPSVADALADRALAVLDRADLAAARVGCAEAPAPDQAPTSTAPATADSAVEPPLPPGWAATRDDASGAVYYYNTSTSETTWVRPST